jgi:Tol biopolymer transport system component
LVDLRPLAVGSSPTAVRELVARVTVAILAVTAPSLAGCSGGPVRHPRQALAGPKDGPRIFSASISGSDHHALNVTGVGLARGPDGRIAFIQGHNLAEGGKLAVMDDNGSHLRVLAPADQGSENPVAPSWSPDGHLLAVSSGRGCSLYTDCRSWSISIVDAKSGKRRALIRWAKEASWSPDGRKIAFAGGRVPGDPHAKLSFGIYIARADGTGRRLIARGDLPAWSPTGKLIAYNAISRTGTLLGLHLIRPDGTGDRSLGRSEEVFDWSPDGERVAYLAPEGLPTALSIASRSGRVVRRLRPADLTFAGGIAWSPDGSKVAWVAFDGARDADRLFLARSVGPNESVQLVHTQRRHRIWTPVFSSNGKRVIYSLFRFAR